MRWLGRYYVLLGMTFADGVLWWVVFFVPLSPTQWRNELILAIAMAAAVLYFWLSPLHEWGIKGDDDQGRGGK